MKQNSHWAGYFFNSDGKCHSWSPYYVPAMLYASSSMVSLATYNMKFVVSAQVKISLQVYVLTDANCGPNVKTKPNLQI